MGDEKAEKELRALCKLFIGGIPRSVTDEQLAEAFLQYTNDETLNDCVVIKDDKGSSRGFGFVTYNSLSDTDNCLANRPHKLAGKEVEVKHAIPREEQNPTNHTRTNKIFVGGLSDVVEEDVQQAVETHTLPFNGEPLNVKVDKVDIIKKDGQPRGFCFLELASEDDADKAVIVKYFNIKGKRVELKKAEPKMPRGSMGGGMGGGRGGRGSSRGGGGGRMGNFGGNPGVWGNGSTPYGDGYGFGGMGGGFSGGNSSYNFYEYNQSSFGPSRTSNSGGRFGRGGRGGGFRPY